MFSVDLKLQIVFAQTNKQTNTSLKQILIIITQNNKTINTYSAAIVQLFFSVIYSF